MGHTVPSWQKSPGSSSFLNVRFDEFTKGPESTLNERHALLV